MDLSGNMISKIQPRSLAKLGLGFLYLSGNFLTELDNTTFARIDSVFIIDLASNMLTKIAPGTFNGITSLQIIILDFNQLTHLDSTMFAGCDNLLSISVKNNTNIVTDNLKSLCPTTAKQCTVIY